MRTCKVPVLEVYKHAPHGAGQRSISPFLHQSDVRFLLWPTTTTLFWVGIAIASFASISFCCNSYSEISLRPLNSPFVILFIFKIFIFYFTDYTIHISYQKTMLLYLKLKLITSSHKNSRTLSYIEWFFDAIHRNMNNMINNFERRIQYPVDLISKYDSYPRMSCFF